MANRPALQDETPASMGPAVRSDAGNRLLYVIWERRWLVFSCVVVMLICGIVYLAKATPIYSSFSRVFLEQSNPRIMSDSGSGAIDYSGNFLADQMELIRSPAILTNAAAAPEVASSKSFKDASNPAGTLLSMLSIEVGKQTDILRITANSPDPTEAAVVVNAVVNAYVDYQMQKQHSTAAEVLKILQKEKGRRDAELDDLTKRMMEFKRDNGVLSFENDKGNIITQRLAELSEAVNVADMDLLNATLLKQEIDSVGNDGHKIKQLLQAEFARGVQINVGGDTSEEAQELKRIKSEVASLHSTYGDKDPKVQEAQRELDAMKEELDQADAQSVSDDHAVVDQIYLKAQRKDVALHKDLDQQQVAAMALNAKAAEYAKLESDERRTEKMSDLLDSRIKEINVTDDYGALNLTVLETAKASLLPVSPIAMKVLGESLIAGLVLGIISAMARDWLDQRLRSVEEIAALMDIPVLGLVPSMPGKQSRAERAQAVHLAPRSPVAESYRTLRTAFYFGTPAGRMKTLLITSPSPADGKSTVASNIAIAMAQAGERVLLLDADCRRPTQHRIFELNARVGLCDILLGKATAEQAIQQTKITNLDVLPCGQLPTNPAEILNSLEFNDLLTSLAAKYDRVILDSPPVMPVTDARILSAFCDATIIVLRAGRSNRKVSTHAVDSLRGVGATILGAVVNDVSYKTGRYGYYGGYGYLAQYGPEVVTPANGELALNEQHLNGNGHDESTHVASIASGDEAAGDESGGNEASGDAGDATRSASKSAPRSLDS